jgi:hypothetical protein
MSSEAAAEIAVDIAAVAMAAATMLLVILVIMNSPHKAINVIAINITL